MNEIPEGLAMVSVDRIHPCKLQPRVNVSVEFVRKLAESMRAGRHDPLLEVEPSPAEPGHFQIVCGEQRWRAAKDAGIHEVLVRLHPPLGFLERLQKQYEENRLRSDLDPVEDAAAVQLTKLLFDVGRAEELLSGAAVTFQPLDGKRITARDDLHSHLEELKRLLVDHKVHVVTAQGRLVAASLTPWSLTERHLGISETARKNKLAVLRLEPELLEEVRGLPSHHTALIARVANPDHRAELVARAPQLSHRQLHAAVRRLRDHDELTVADALVGDGADRLTEADDPLRLEAQLATLVDLCRQIVRILANLRPRLANDQQRRVADVLRAVASSAQEFDA